MREGLGRCDRCFHGRQVCNIRERVTPSPTDPGQTAKSYPSWYARHDFTLGESAALFRFSPLPFRTLTLPPSCSREADRSRGLRSVPPPPPRPPHPGLGYRGADPRARAPSGVRSGVRQRIRGWGRRRAHCPSSRHDCRARQRHARNSFRSRCDRRGRCFRVRRVLLRLLRRRLQCGRRRQRRRNEG